MRRSSLQSRFFSRYPALEQPETLIEAIPLRRFSIRHSHKSRDAAQGPKGGILWIFRILGPGLITGAADDDPSGIATYSQTGAQFGFGLLWTALYQIPLLLAVQECCGRIGLVTGKGLAGVIKEHYTRSILIGTVLLVLVANTINIGADIGAVAAAAQLVAPAPFFFYAAATTVLVVTLEVWVTYKTYAKILKWLALALLSYPATTFIIAQPWGEIFRATVVPHVEFTAAFFFIITGVFGTTISPYMFFWQASEEVEEEIVAGIRTGKRGKPLISLSNIRDMRVDTAIGMVASELIQWFIIITTGSVLFSHGIKTINTAADAAKALQPLVSSFPNSGLLAGDLFALGIIGVGLLAIPVLAGSAAYALAEAFDWREGLSARFTEARSFYGVIVAATGLGLLLNFVGVDPIKALVLTAVFNGIAAVPLLFLIAKINANEKILEANCGGALSRIFVWLSFGVMGLCAVALLYTSVFQH
jgi:NRAMP (natural resistance-associated macrophage protein)-like metal ion transporter